MIPRLAVAFVIGGIAAGSIVWFARSKPAPAPQPVAVIEALPRAQEILPEAPAPAPQPVPQPVPRALPKAKPAMAAKAAPAPVAARPPVAVPAPPPAPPVAVPSPAPVPVVRNAEPTSPPAPAILKPSRDQAPATPPRQPQTVTIPAGTLITVRLRDTLRASKAETDETFHATLDQPIIVNGLVLAERGTLQRGRITESSASGRVKGRAALALELTQLTTSDGQTLDIQTEAFRKEADSSAKSDIAKAGALAGIGAAIGAIAGGGKGAAIGAAAGGAAGAGTVLATKGKDAELPSETRITFRLREPVTLTERLN